LRAVTVGFPGDRRAARIGLDESEQHPQRCRLAGPVRAEERHHGALLDAETQLIDGQYRPESLGEAAGLDDCHVVMPFPARLGRTSWMTAGRSRPWLLQDAGGTMLTSPAERPRCGGPAAVPARRPGSPAQ
jgi:hypothetical protein